MNCLYDSEVLSWVLIGGMAGAVLSAVLQVAIKSFCDWRLRQ